MVNASGSAASDVVPAGRSSIPSAAFSGAGSATISHTRAREADRGTPAQYTDQRRLTAEDPGDKRARIDSTATLIPKDGSWLNIAEIEFSVLNCQYLDRRNPDRATLAAEVAACVADRGADGTAVDWGFTTDYARTKLHHLYPVAQAPNPPKETSRRTSHSRGS